MSTYNTIQMHQPPSGLGPMSLGFAGGMVTLINSMPKPILSSVGGALIVTALISFSSYVGKTAGVLVWRHLVKKIKDFKNKNK